MLPVIIFAAVLVLFLVVVGAIIYTRHVRYMDAFRSFAGVSIAWRDTADVTKWSSEQLWDTLQSLLEVLESHTKNSAVSDKILVEIFGPDDKITGSRCPTGTVRDTATGEHKPVKGTSDEYRPVFFLPPKYALRIRQLRRADGSFVSPQGSTIWHEGGQHVLSKLLGEGWNTAHVVKYTLATQEMVEAFARRSKARVAGTKVA